MPHQETETLVPFPNPDAVLRAFVDHVESDHDVSFTDEDGGYRVVENAGFRIALRARQDGLQIKLSGPNPAMMIFFKDAISQHVAHIDAELAQGMRWSGETATEGELPANFRILRVVRTSEPLPGMVRLTLSVADQGIFENQGLHLKMMLPSVVGRQPVWPRMGPNGAPVWPQGEDMLHARFLTIKAMHPHENLIDLDVVCHGDGLISSWAMSAAPGDEIGAMGPTGPEDLPEVDRVFLAADQTGLPLVARVLERLPNHVTGHVIGAAQDLDVLVQYLPPTKLHVSHIPSADFSDHILPRATELAAEGTYGAAVFAGEFADAQALRKVFKGKMGLGKGEQLSLPYWRKGEAGFES